MATDNALLVAGQGTFPLDYTVPNAQEIIVLSARAVVDGSSALTAYLPVVQLVSDAGVILAEAITDASVAAGASAQVSWFPGVKSVAAAATALNLPWGYTRAPVTNLASSTGLTAVDFNPAVSGGVGYTSGDPSITFGDNGTGRYSLIFNSVGMYLQFSSFTCQTAAAPAAGSAAFLSSQWLSGARLIGPSVAGFAQLPGSALWLAHPAGLAALNANGTSVLLPKAGNTSIAQNSTQLASGNVWQFAVDISAITNPGGV